MQIIPKLINYASEKRLEIVLKHTLVDRQTYRLYKEKMLIIQHVFFLQRKEEMLHCKWILHTASFTLHPSHVLCCCPLRQISAKSGINKYHFNNKHVLKMTDKPTKPFIKVSRSVKQVALQTSPMLRATISLTSFSITTSDLWRTAKYVQCT